MHRRKEGLSSVACRAEHPKEGGCLNAPVFRGAAAVEIAKQLREALGEALEGICLCHKLLFKGNKICCSFLQEIQSC